MAPVTIRLEATHTPLEALSRFADLPGLCLLQSAAAEHPLSRYSFLAADPVATITANAAEWSSVRDQVRSTLGSDSAAVAGLPPFQGGWAGWFGYELGTAFDDVARHPNQPLPVSDIALGLYDWVIAWDHRLDAVWLISTGIDATGERDASRAQARTDAVLTRWTSAQTQRDPTSTGSESAGGVAKFAAAADFTASEYEAAVARVVDYVLAGDIFQANIAQRFTTPFSGDPLALYTEVMRKSPAPMAAFLQQGAVSIVSASPERFMRLDAGTRLVETRPIKGTRPRDRDTARDAALARELEASEKDRAENVMIVDLLRNDLARVCEPRSVRTPQLCALESHATVHHLVSTVTGVLSPGRDSLDLLAATFPGGSITGAPKLRAMEIITELEPVARGVYAGAIGWLGLDGSMDTSIAIRTVTIAGGIASLHAGGGITALSEPDEEYRETLDKARALLEAVAEAP